MITAATGIAGATVLAVAPAFGDGAKTQRISVGLNGAHPNGDSYTSSYSRSISSKGRFIAFTSDATNLVRGDRNGHADVFVRDFMTGRTRRVSVASDGTEAFDASGSPSISPMGRFVAFTSYAGNLVEGDTNGNGAPDVFIHNVKNGRTRRVSVGVGGAEPDGGSITPSVSEDGRFVAFASGASNLVEGVDGGVFVRDLATGRTRLVSVNSRGVAANRGGDLPSISADGRFIAFRSRATNLVEGDDRDRDYFVHDRKTRETELVSGSHGAYPSYYSNDAPSISGNGRYVAFRSGNSEIYVHDRKTGRIRHVSVSPSGNAANGHCLSPSISGHGRLVVFRSYATNLVKEDKTRNSSVFVRDLETGKTRRVSIRSNGAETERDSYGPEISDNGRFVAFYSYASLVKGDTNRRTDVYRRGPLG
jgi:Tol biopolymer transport system component